MPSKESTSSKRVGLAPPPASCRSSALMRGMRSKTVQAATQNVRSMLPCSGASNNMNGASSSAKPKDNMTNGVSGASSAASAQPASKKPRAQSSEPQPKLAALGLDVGAEKKSKYEGQVERAKAARESRGKAFPNPNDQDQCIEFRERLHNFAQATYKLIDKGMSGAVQRADINQRGFLAPSKINNKMTLADGFKEANPLGGQEDPYVLVWCAYMIYCFGVETRFPKSRWVLFAEAMLKQSMRPTGDAKTHAASLVEGFLHIKNKLQPFLKDLHKGKGAKDQLLPKDTFLVKVVWLLRRQGCVGEHIDFNPTVWLSQHDHQAKFCGPPDDVMHLWDNLMHSVGDVVPVKDLGVVNKEMMQGYRRNVDVEFFEPLSISAVRSAEKLVTLMTNMYVPSKVLKIDDPAGQPEEQHAADENEDEGSGWTILDEQETVADLFQLNSLKKLPRCFGFLENMYQGPPRLPMSTALEEAWESTSVRRMLRDETLPERYLGTLHCATSQMIKYHMSEATDKKTEVTPFVAASRAVLDVWGHLTDASCQVVFDSEFPKAARCLEEVRTNVHKIRDASKNFSIYEEYLEVPYSSIVMLLDEAVNLKGRFLDTLVVLTQKLYEAEVVLMDEMKKRGITFYGLQPAEMYFSDREECKKRACEEVTRMLLWSESDPNGLCFSRMARREAQAMWMHCVFLSYLESQFCVKFLIDCCGWQGRKILWKTVADDGTRIVEVVQQQMTMSSNVANLSLCSVSASSTKDSSASRISSDLQFSDRISDVFEGVSQAPKKRMSKRHEGIIPSEDSRANLSPPAKKSKKKKCLLF